MNAFCSRDPPNIHGCHSAYWLWTATLLAIAFAEVWGFSCVYAFPPLTLLATLSLNCSKRAFIPLCAATWLVIVLLLWGDEPNSGHSITRIVAGFCFVVLIALWHWSRSAKTSVPPQPLDGTEDGLASQSISSLVSDECVSMGPLSESGKTLGATKFGADHTRIFPGLVIEKLREKNQFTEQQLSIIEDQLKESYQSEYDYELAGAQLPFGMKLGEYLLESLIGKGGAGPGVFGATNFRWAPDRVEGFASHQTQ